MLRMIIMIAMIPLALLLIEQIALNKAKHSLSGELQKKKSLKLRKRLY